MSQKYIRLQKEGKSQFVKLFRDRDYFRKLKIPSPQFGEFYLQGDLTDRIGGSAPIGYDDADSKDGYTKGTGLCCLKERDGIVISEAFENIASSELGGWYITNPKDGSYLREYSESSFHVKMTAGNAIHVATKNKASQITAQNNFLTIRLKYKQTAGTQFGMKIYGATWNPPTGEKTSHVEIATGEWTETQATFELTNYLGHGQISFEPSTAVYTELEVKDFVVSYGQESLPFDEFTDVSQPGDGFVQYPIPSAITSNNYILGFTIRGYNPVSDYAYFLTFNETFPTNNACGICIQTSVFDLPKDKDINFLFVRNGAYKIGYMQCDGMVYEITQVGDWGVRPHLIFDEQAYGTKMNLGACANGQYMVNTKIKNLFIGRFNDTEWQREDGTLSMTQLTKYFMNNGVFDIPVRGEDRLIQNSFIKNRQNGFFDVLPDMTMEVIG